MSINLDKAKKEFLDFTEKYDMENKNLKRKQLHSLRVMDISRKIAEGLGLTQEEIDIATLIGLLHDIGRFKQYQDFGFGDNLKGFDHGDYGVEILNQDIRNFIDDDKYDVIIKKAVKNHNKFKIEDGLSDKELLFAQIVRDADKIDILFEAKCMFWVDEEKSINESVLSDFIYDRFKKCELVKKDRRYDGIDGVMIVLAFVFDINFKSSYEIIFEENYIDDILSRFSFFDVETRKKINELNMILNNYVKNKINV